MWKEKDQGLPPNLLYPSPCPPQMMIISYFQMLRAKPLASPLTHISHPIFNSPEIPFGTIL